MNEVEKFLANGGKIQKVEEGHRALSPKELLHRSRGDSDYTDASMRQAENRGILDNLDYSRSLR